MNPYKCESHKLDFACLGCVRAWIARHDAMLKFITSIANHVNFNETQDEFMNFYTKKENEAYQLLKEIGKCPYCEYMKSDCICDSPDRQYIK
jgi:hypothetical protein